MDTQRKSAHEIEVEVKPSVLALVRPGPDGETHYRPLRVVTSLEAFLQELMKSSQDETGELDTVRFESTVTRELGHGLIMPWAFFDSKASLLEKFKSSVVFEQLGEGRTERVAAICAAAMKLARMEGRVPGN